MPLVDSQGGKSAFSSTRVAEYVNRGAQMSIPKAALGKLIDVIVVDKRPGFRAIYRRGYDPVGVRVEHHPSAGFSLVVGHDAILVDPKSNLEDAVFTIMRNELRRLVERRLVPMPVPISDDRLGERGR
jgi:hypothetical protein